MWMDGLGLLSKRSRWVMEDGALGWWLCAQAQEEGMRRCAHHLPLALELELVGYCFFEFDGSHGKGSGSGLEGGGCGSGSKELSISSSGL